MSVFNYSRDASPGYFNDENRTYVIQHMFPPRLWRNYLWNEHILSGVDQFGCGASWHFDNQGVRSELCCAGWSRLVFIREGDRFWSPNRNFFQEPFTEFYTTVGQGYTRVTGKYRSAGCDFTVTIPPEHNGELWQLCLTNHDKCSRQLSLYVLAAIDVNSTGHTAYNHGAMTADGKTLLFSHHGYNMPGKYPHIIFAADSKPDAYETSERYFTGIYGSRRQPAALSEEKLSCRDTSFDDDMLGVFQFDLELAAGENKSFNFNLSLLNDKKTVSDTNKIFLSSSAADTVSRTIQEQAEKFMQNVWIKTPDAEVNSLTNIWFKRQMNLGKTWGRGYTKGFRDIMQDVTGIMPLDRETAAEKIIYCLQHQWDNGNCLRQWEPELRHPYRDGAAWIIPAVNCYLKESGDWNFLKENVPYFESKQSGSILDHCRRGLAFLTDNPGPHNLCLWGGGDWNDSLNAAGLQGKGESVWLTQAAVVSLQEFAAMLSQLGHEDEAAGYREQAEHLRRALKKAGWDKDHFICGINDWQEKIGAYVNREGQIYLNMQSWAVLAEVVQGKAAHQLMDLVEDKLGCSFGYVLNTPSYSSGDDHIGRVSYMEKGSYENGSVYNHGVAFKIAADCKLGRAEQAYTTLKKILPQNPANPALVSGCEPYAITNMYLGPENRLEAGRSVYGWITGTAGWLFRCVTEYMLGVQADYNGLRIAPCLPRAWHAVDIRRRFRGAVYNISIINEAAGKPSKQDIKFDGKSRETNVLPLPEKGEHMVEVKLL